MSQALSQVMLDVADLVIGQGHPTMDPALGLAADEGPITSDYLRRFPTEVRLMIFEELLVASGTVFRGASTFGPLDENEFNEEASISWQILATCRKYFEETAPILYGRNKFVFCTGEGGEPGKFWRFPISRRYMHYLNDLEVFVRADDPKKEAAKRVAHFLKALIRHAPNLDHFTLLISSDRFYEAQCPFDILFADHPISEELLHLIEAETVKHLKIRLHDGACFSPHYAGFLAQKFMEKGSNSGRSITFTISCTCPPGCPEHPTNDCMICGWPRNERASKPIEWVLPSPAYTEPCMKRMMDMQDDLFKLGLWPDMDEDDRDDEEYLVNSGPYKIIARDVFEDLRPAFRSGLWYRGLDCRCNACTSQRGSIIPGQDHRYLGQMMAPMVWYYRQPKITEFFKLVEYETYLHAVTG